MDVGLILRKNWKKTFWESKKALKSRKKNLLFVKVR